jgi:hypothetical protein
VLEEDLAELGIKPGNQFLLESLALLAYQRIDPTIQKLSGFQDGSAQGVEIVLVFIACGGQPATEQGDTASAIRELLNGLDFGRGRIVLTKEFAIFFLGSV